jgi:hypothetical protein
MRHLFRWIGNILSAASGGPVILEVNDPGLVLPPADDAAPRWVTTVAVLTLPVVIVLILLSVPWPTIAIAAGVLLLPLLISRLHSSSSRRQRHPGPVSRKR